MHTYLLSWQMSSQTWSWHGNNFAHLFPQDHSLLLHLLDTGLLFEQQQVIVTVLGQGGQGPRIKKNKKKNLKRFDKLVKT